MTELSARAEGASSTELLSPDLPAFSTLLDRAIDQIFRIDDIEDRFAVCLYFLKDDTLGYRQNEVMVDLLGVVRQMMSPERHMDVDRLLSRLTRFFRLRDNQFLLMRFQCYEAIGVAIGQAGNVAGADHLIEDVLSWKFQYPEIQGATDEWETVVNQYHLPKIRCWMHIIESNPALYERLAAALNVQLRLGGVYIADTDLFQREVTRFLNADIRPIYFVAKQLLRAFPIYFNDVGAEGELRAVSTELDEICGRRDTLMHFLRKQSHAESSNRLVDFSREVLTYWVTLDPAGLRPYLSPNTWNAVCGEKEWAVGPHAVLDELRHALSGSARPRAKRPSAAEVKTLLDQLASRHRRPWRSGSTRSPTAKSCTGRLAAGWPSWSAPTNCSRRSTRCPPTTSEQRSATDCSWTSRRETASLKALKGWTTKPGWATRDRLLDASLTLLEELQRIILSPGPFGGR